MPVYIKRGDGTIVDPVMSQISVGYPSEDFSGSLLFPAVRVTKQTDKYAVFGKEAETLDTLGDQRAPGSVANEVEGVTLSNKTYYAAEHALQIAVHDEERELDPSLGPDQEATEIVTSKVLLKRELLFAAMATTAANYPAAHTQTLAGVTQWSDYVNSDPIGAWKTARLQVRSAINVDPNFALIPFAVLIQLQDHPDFIERIKYSERGIITQEIVQVLIGMPRISIPGSVYNTANPGQAATLAAIWGKDVVIAYVPPNPGRKIPAYGYEFVWSYPDGLTQHMDRWREENRKSDLLRCSRRYDVKHIAVDGSDKAIAGYLFKAAVA